MTRGQVLAIRAEPQPIRLVDVLSASVPAGGALRLRADGVVAMRAVESLKLTANGVPMGSEVTQPSGAPRVFAITIRGTAPLEQVQVISCGAVLADLPVETDALDFAATWADERPGRPLGDCYYYVRARQADGHCVWMSPVWFDLPAPG